MSPSVTGRAGTQTAFGPKDPKTRFQGILTREGGKLLEVHRKKLAALLKQITGKRWRVSDADAIEFALRGPENTTEALQVRLGGLVVPPDVP